MPKNKANSQGPQPTEVRFKYIKSNYFRVIHADGAWGGVSPHGNIHMSLYNERTAIPDSSIITIGEDGQPKPEKFELSSQLIREIEADVILDLATATALRTWLDDKIAALKQLLEEARKAQDQQKDQKTLKIQR